MSKQERFEPENRDMNTKSGVNANKLTDKELDQVSAGTKDSAGCPRCGGMEIFFNPGIGAWICSKCNNCWT